MALWWARGASGRVSADKSVVYGPALRSRIVTPARYLFIQAADEDGVNFTSSAGAGAFRVQVHILVGGKKKQLKTEVQDRGDGSYQAVFWYGIQPEALIISVTTKEGKYVRKEGEESARSGPITLKKVEVEQCYCPDPDPERWAKSYQCREEEPQISRDFQQFEGISNAGLEDMKQILRRNDSNCFVHYVVRNNELYGKAYGKYQGFKKYTDDMLLSLMRRVVVPDVEFLWNVGDWPLTNKSSPPFPVLSFCGSASSYDVIVPTYKLFLSTVFGKDLENVNDVDGKCYTAGGGWERKIGKLFWRGRDSNPQRVKFVEGIASEHRDLIDANISKNHMNYYPSEEERMRDKLLQAGKKVERVNFLSFWRYKYLLSLDGTVAAYRMPALLAGDSVVVKQSSEWYEHFYSELLPFTHYIPVKEDLSDLLLQLHWAR
ncbi:hypothetical protein GUITHDRAFT_120208 [Guillardia theta CCMP2712]|uniref:Glycosyl transferase CAP10 domain-containing protein n=2 Tax=Guillardia theta TaxID=55529 RepID=L1ICQ4_GUITC|nr:hypothetical protein GUITHDRAFT_120208 [Guillardia theta CCMP2712]EKX33620.1 hypothetical protein GUITHDRAFT_120208 [Guillardia theta CCMP2712]|eukprot:XP_005820600.1 hypothetical protein GUITHDRAFT_120208 [Guillardia theta CCMP2712]